MLRLHCRRIETNFPARFVLDMVHNNPGEPPQPTAFRDPRRLADWGYNGQVIDGRGGFVRDI